MSAEYTRPHIFGKDSNPTIYYLVGHGGKVSQYRLHIKYLVWRGFRVVAFEYDPKILVAGEPERLVSTTIKITNHVKRDQAKGEVAGVYGISLGCFIGMNVMTRAGIKRGMFNTGPANLTEVVWGAPDFSVTREAFKNNGYNREGLAMAWQPIEMPAFASKLAGSKLLFMNSKDDEIVTYENYLATVSLLRDVGVTEDSIITKRYGHVSVIIRNLFRLKTVTRFFGGDMIKS